MEIEHCVFPDDLFYDPEEDVWVRLERGDLVTIGVTTIRSFLAGPILTVKFKPLGIMVDRGRSIGMLESARHVGAVRTPFTGVLKEVNAELLSHPKLLNVEPYGSGWFAKLVPSRLDEELPLLSRASHAEKSLRRRIGELHVRCFAAFPDYEMFEIGIECAAALTKLDELLSKAELGTVVHIVSDDPTAEIEMHRWSDQTGQRLIETRAEGNLKHFIVKKLREAGRRA